MALRRVEVSVVTHTQILSGVQISFRRLTKAGATSEFWLKLTDVKRHWRKVEHLLTS